MEMLLVACKDWLQMVVVFFMAVPVFFGQMISFVLDPEKKQERCKMVEKYWPYAVGISAFIITIIVIAKIVFKNNKR